MTHQKNIIYDIHQHQEQILSEAKKKNKFLRDQKNKVDVIRDFGPKKADFFNWLSLVLLNYVILRLKIIFIATTFVLCRNRISN